MSIIGYARTSTIDQVTGLDAQQRDLVAAGAVKIFAERISSIAGRLHLAECLAYLRDGYVLMVTKPDRLARSTGELLGIVADLKACVFRIERIQRSGSPEHALSQEHRFRSGDTDHHFDLDLDFRFIECLDANRRDAGHSVPEQLTKRGDGLPERFAGRIHDVDTQHDNVFRSRPPGP